MAMLETKAAACQKLGDRYGLSIDWAALLKALLAAFGGCGLAASEAAAHICNPGLGDELVMHRVANGFVSKGRERRAAVEVVKTVCKQTSHTEAKELIAEVPAG